MKYVQTSGGAAQHNKTHWEGIFLDVMENYGQCLILGRQHLQDILEVKIGKKYIYIFCKYNIAAAGKI